MAAAFELAEEPEGEIPKDVYTESLLGALEGKQDAADGGRVYEGSCGICLNDAPSGSTNSITLPCGHTFHWSGLGTDCQGLFQWTLDGNTDCPLCRSDFVPGSNEVHLGDEPDIEEDGEALTLSIDWNDE